MLAVVVIVLMTHNLALGVLIGVLLSALFLVNKLENAVRVQSHLLNSTTRKYEIFGQIFFSSSEKFFQFFDFNESVDHVIIDLTHAHIWDITSVSMLNQVQNKFLQNNIQVEIIGMNEASRSLVDQFSAVK